jgi:hypothetical protein
MLLCLPLALLLEDAAALAHLAVRTLAGLARAHPRLALAGATAVCGLGLAAGLLAASGRGPGPYVLSEHIKEAKVFRNELACDYFNMRIERWECSKVEEDYWENTGLALSADECLFDKTKGPRIWFHPPKGPASKRLVFDNVPAGGTLHLRFGLADSAVSGETCFTVSYGGAKPTRLCTTRAGRLMESRVQAPPAEGLTSVELTIQSPPEAKRHLCLDGTILPAGD